MYATDRMQNSKGYYEGFYGQIQCGRGAEAAMRSCCNRKATTPVMAVLFGYASCALTPQPLMIESKAV